MDIMEETLYFLGNVNFTFLFEVASSFNQNDRHISFIGTYFENTLHYNRDYKRTYVVAGSFKLKDLFERPWSQ
jgi:hypothetical protein